jgi:hypothetical protein
LNIPLHEVWHILYLFVFGVPAHRIKQYSQVSLKTIHKVFTIIRAEIYEKSICELKQANISGEIEIDETMFGGKHSGKRLGIIGKTDNL